MNDSRVRMSFLKSNQHLTYTSLHEIPSKYHNQMKRTRIRFKSKTDGANSSNSIYRHSYGCVYISWKQKMKRSVERNMGWVLPSKDSMDFALHAGFPFSFYSSFEIAIYRSTPHLSPSLLPGTFLWAKPGITKKAKGKRNIMEERSVI